MHLFVLLSTIITLASSATIDANLCAEGESFWCSSPDAAEACGKVKHCKETVWKSSTLEDSFSTFVLAPSSCSDCTKFFTSMKNFLNNETPAFIQDIILDQLCAKLGKQQKLCEATVKSFFTSTFQTLLAFIDPKVICKLLKQCPRTETDSESELLHLHLSSSNLKEMMQALSEMKMEAKLVQPSSCQDCTKFFAALKKFMDTDTQNFIQSLVLNEVCTRLGADQKKACEDLVKSCLPNVIHFAVEFINPKTTCTQIKMCPKSEKEFQESYSELYSNDLDMNILMEDSSLERDDIVSRQPTSCTDCTNFFLALKSLLTDSAVPFLDDILLDQVCPRVRGYKKQCEEFVKTFLPMTVRILVNFLDPKMVCGAMKMCPNWQDESDLEQTQFDLKSIIQDQTLYLSVPSQDTFRVNDPKKSCADCIKFFSSLKNFLQKETMAMLNDILLDQLCPRMGRYKKTCEDFVKIYLPNTIDVLINFLDPKVVCSGIKMCPKSEMADNDSDQDFLPWEDLVLLLGQIEGESATKCEKCKKGVLVVQKTLKSVTLRTAFQQFLSKFVCTFTGPFLPVCKVIVNTVLPSAIDLLVREMDPDKMCRRLRLCPKLDANPGDSFSASDDEGQIPESGRRLECDVCEKTIQLILRAIDFNKTEAESLKAMRFLCSSAPAPFAGQCKRLVDSYGKQILDAFFKKLKPHEICTLLRFCDASDAHLQNLVASFVKERCLVCQSAAQYLEAYLDQMETVSAIERQLKKLCHFFPSDKENNMCESLLEKYIPPLIHELSVFFSPKLFCEKVRLCTDLTSVDFLFQEA